MLGYLRTNWSQDPYAYGSYSHIAKGAWRKDHRRIAAPIANRVFFAGEAANPHRNSSVHAALETGRTAAKDLLAQKHQRIGIIGAGISGLVAAHTLAKAGREVQVIEARSRIGGRIHSDSSLGFAADLGASWLHGIDGNPLTELVGKAGMRKYVYQSSTIARADGRELAENDYPAWIEEVIGYDNHAGTSEAYLNKWAYLFGSDYSGDEYLFPDGYQQMLDLFIDDYTVILNQPIREISYDANGVSVTSDSLNQTFDAVIVTVPLGVLKKGDIRFTPPLPQDKQGAIDRLGFGVLDKIYLQFDKVFWDKDIQNIITPFNNQPQGYYNSWVNLYPVTGKPVLIAFNGGPAAHALSSQSDDTVVQGALSTILSAYGQGS